MDQSVGDGEWALLAPNLMKNLSILLPDQVELAKILLNEGQGHLFHHWKRPGINDERKKSFFDQVRILNGSYPGGLLSYIRNSISLLADSKAGKNPYDSFVPSVPSGEVVTFGDDNFLMLEKIGIEEARRATFVLVAGGLGERLEYKGIKLTLPSESTICTCFLQHYIESITALQDASCRQKEEKSQIRIPLVIMTSDDTRSATLHLLESNSYFGMGSTQVKLLK